MKKLVVILATLGLMFNVIGCKAKKAQDETEIVENADVEKIEAEDASFAGTESAAQAGPVDESLQAALGETPQTDAVAAGTLPEASAPATDVVNSDATVNTDIAATPTLDEATLGNDVAAMTPPPETAITESPVVENPIDSPAASMDIAANEPPTDSSLTPDPVMGGGIAEMNAAALGETPITETPVADQVSASPVEPPAAAMEPKQASSKSASASASAPVAKASTMKKITEVVPYKHGEGFVNAIYIARPKEKLADISRNIYGMDKSKDLKSINSFLKSRGPKAGDRIAYVSPNRPTDSSRTISFYEDTGMTPANYVSEKGENLTKVSKKLLGYDTAWKEVWATNDLGSKTKLAAGESIRYWKPASEQIKTSPTLALAKNTGAAKIVESANQMPPPQEVAAAMPPPPPAEMAAPPQPQAQELPPPPPPPQEVAQQAQPQAELPPPPPQEMTPPPPPPQEVAAAPVPPKQHNMEEEPAVEEAAGGMNSDTMMMAGVVAVLGAALALVLVRRNKKKKEADLASIEQNHVGT